MEKILAALRKFWIVILAFVGAGFMAMLYTGGAALDPNAQPAEKVATTTSSVEKRDAANQSLSTVDQKNDFSDGSPSFKIGPDTVKVTGSVALNGKYNLISNQMPDKESLQLHVVDSSLTSMDDDSARPEQFFLTFYIEKNDPVYCHLNFCNLPVLKEIKASTHVWQYRGSATYEDAGYDSEFPHVYSTLVGNYIVYLHSKEYLPDSSTTELKNFFNSVTFTIQ